MEKFDLIVIGAGSGLGVMSAAASRGMKVALVEEGPMGGTCLNRGCIPTKVLLHTADIVDTIERAGEFGISASIKAIDFKKIMHRAMDEVDSEARGIEESIKKEKMITLFKGKGAFIGNKTIRVNGGDITAEKIVIAAGTRPMIPDIEGLGKVPYMTSDQALRLETLPKELIIIGGGYIAMEFSHFFSSMGSDVIVLQRNAKLLPHEDEEISAKFGELYARHCKVRLGYQIASVEKKGSKVIVHGKDGSKVSGTHLLVATGRVPNTDILDVAKTGIKTNAKGYIAANEFMETSVPGIWALGDIVGRYLFKHSANLEAEYVTHNLLNEHGHKVAIDYTAMPHAIFSNPQIAGVGATEQDLKAKGEDYLVGKYKYGDTGMGLALIENEGFVKFLTDYDGKILGCHIIGPEAAALLHEVLVSMKAGHSHVNDIVKTIHIHPALNEVVQRAAGEV
jgi:mycothione reductase